MNVLLELLELWRMDSSKVLIFSYSLKLLDLIEVRSASRSQTSRKNARRLSVGDKEPNMWSASQFPQKQYLFLSFDLSHVLLCTHQHGPFFAA